MQNLILNGTDVTDDLLAFAQSLVRIRSYSGQEQQVARAIAAKMESLGYDEVNIDRFGNVLGRIGRGSQGILFDSHTDTVKVDDEELWAHPPFSGEIAGGYLWGRGSVDMKSGLAASVYAAALARGAGLLDGKTVYVSCTVFEEDCDGEGLRHLLADGGLRPACAIICEPSDNAIVTGHKGKAQVILKTQGLSAHGSAPEKGVNAVYEMADIIQRVEQANQELMRKPGSRGTLVLSRISSTAVSLNAVPSGCEIYLDRRMALGETEADIRAEMDRLIAGKKATWQVDRLQRTTWTGEHLDYEPFHLAWQIAPGHALTRALSAACTEVSGRAPDKFDFWDFSTNAVTPVRLGIPTIGFGPGEYKLAHMRDEKCATGQIIEACGVYAALIGRL